MHDRRKVRGVFVAALVVAGLAAQSRAQDTAFAGRPGLAGPEQEPGEIPTCETLPRSMAGFRQPSERVDLWVTGPLTLIHTDGVLWYLVVCPPPGIRVMCVTYSLNGMTLGEQVTLRGALMQQDERHLALDPCLASRS